MKKIFLIGFLIIQTTALFAQDQIGKPALTSEDYLERSKKQKKAARISMATGVGLLGVSLLAIAVIPPNAGEDNESRGTVITGLGLAGIATGTYLHIASKKNKKRAAQTSVFFDVQRSPSLSRAGIKSESYPSIGLQIRL